MHGACMQPGEEIIYRSRATFCRCCCCCMGGGSARNSGYFIQRAADSVMHYVRRIARLRTPACNERFVQMRTWVQFLSELFIQS